MARPVEITLWISGGCNQILTAGREAPGLLGVYEHLRQRDPDGYWIDVGGSLDWPQLPGLRRPDAVIPGTEFLRVAGPSPLLREDLPWSLLNAAGLPQYPPVDVQNLHSSRINHPDGPQLLVHGLLPANTPLLVPPARLRPLRILNPQDSVRESLPAWRAVPSGFSILILPEDDDAAGWSRAFQEIPLLVEPPSGPPAVIPLDQGQRLRVRPAAHGRAVIRVTLVWDTVSREFRPPLAEIEWVQAPSLRVELPAPARGRLRPLSRPPEVAAVLRQFPEVVLQRTGATLALVPELASANIPHPSLPESWKATLVPVNDGWTVLTLPHETARNLARQEVPGHQWAGEVRSPTLLAVPNRVLAGEGGKFLHIRTLLDSHNHPHLLVDGTTRDFLPLHP